MASFVLSFFPLDGLDGIWDLIESVSEGFLTYSHVSYSALFFNFYPPQRGAAFIKKIILFLSSKEQNCLHGSKQAIIIVDLMTKHDEKS